ncbi:MAG TPA: hypothetical protein PKM88_16600, partial [bacterium]|nr:hypothetical protein [bacterium]
PAGPDWPTDILQAAPSEYGAAPRPPRRPVPPPAAPAGFSRKLVAVLVILLLVVAARKQLLNAIDIIRNSPEWWHTSQHLSRLDRALHSELRAAERDRHPVKLTLRSFCSFDMNGIDRGVVTDAWQREYRLYFQGRLHPLDDELVMQFNDFGNYVIVSAGRDGRFCTPDDLASRGENLAITKEFRALPAAPEGDGSD